MQTLNKNQLAAATHSGGPVMVLAGPGSGKTTVIIHRIKFLIESRMADPAAILVITFTKAAAEEMRARYAELSGNGRSSISTFHSFFYRVVSSRYGYGTESVLEESERSAAIKTILSGLGLSTDDEFAREISSELSLVKNELYELRHYNSRAAGSDDFRSVYAAYEEYKRAKRVIDFDDMTSECLRLFTEERGVLNKWRGRYRYILIDEFQDINRAQYECVKLLDGNKNLFIVGDDDQSIYRFRGARPEFLLNFESDYKNVSKIFLDVNYRSTDAIIGLCNKIISKNDARFVKDIGGTGRSGPAPSALRPFDAQSEAAAVAERVRALSAKIPYTEMAVIYRTNIQSRAFIDAFLNLNVPYQIKDEAPGIYEHWAFVDVLAYLKLSVDAGLTDEAARIINKPKRYINKDLILAAKKKGGPLLRNLLRAPNAQVWQRAKVEELLTRLIAIKKLAPRDAIKYIRGAAGYDGYINDYAAYRRLRPDGLFEILDELTEGAQGFADIPGYVAFVEKAAISSAEKRLKKEEPAGVTLTTMHSAKGLEFEAVFLTGAIDGLVPHEKSRTPSEVEEERRLFYVGLTRAKTYLYVSAAKTRREHAVKPSSFLDGLLPDERAKKPPAKIKA